MGFLSRLLGFFTRLFGGREERSPEDAFADALITRIKSAGYDGDLEYDADDFRIRLTDSEGDDAGIWNLHNIYVEYTQAEEEDKETVLSHCARTILSLGRDLPDEFEHAKPDLLPSVRSRSYFENADLQGQIEHDRDASVPRHDFAEHLAAGLVYDFPEGMHLITQSTLDDWGVSFYEAMEVAKQNLSERECAVAVLGDSVYVLSTNDAYDSARLLNLELIRRFEVQGQLVALPANRDALIITGSEDPEGLSMLIDLAEQSLDAARPVTMNLYRLVDDEWESWSLPEEHPARSKLIVMQTGFLLDEHSEQKELLEELFEKEHRVVFVASFNAVAKQDTGEAFSYAVWSESVPTLLPRADYVMFNRAIGEDESETLGRVPWDRVQSIAGDLMTPEEFYPPRWLVVDFPTAEQIAAMDVEPL